MSRSKRKHDTEEITRYADMFAAMGTESRLRIMQLLLTAHPEGCLLLYPLPAWEPIHAKVMAFPSLDRQLNSQGYILPGLGDAGDRLFGTRTLA